MGIRLSVKLLWTMLVVLAILVLMLLILLTAFGIADLLTDGGRTDESPPAEGGRGPADGGAATGVGSLEGMRICFLRGRDGNYGLYVMGLNGGRAEKVAEGLRSDTSFDWSPDGSRVAFVDTRNDLYVADADGTDRTLLIERSSNLPGSGQYNPAWSPDGRKIAFESHGGDDAPGLHVVNADGTGKRQIVGERLVSYYYPEWSRDGRSIIVQRTEGYAEMYVVEANGGNQRPLNRKAPLDMNAPAYSPATEKIAYMNSRHGSYEIYVMGADGTGETRLTNNDTVDAYPSWSPGGKKLLYYSIVGDDSEIYMMDADGTGQRRLTDTFEDELEPTWVP